MPKQKITKEMVVEAAFQLAREKGLERLAVRDIAKRLGCSVQPVYSYCNNMEELRGNVTERAGGFVQKYIGARLDKSDFFKSTGRAYVRLAKEEPHIFRMFVMCPRKGVDSFQALYKSEANPRVAEFIAQDLGVGIAKARALHLNMLIYNVGVGTIIATCTPGFGEEEVLGQLEGAYRAFLKEMPDGRAAGKEEEDCV